jgi:HD-like signal output (HDOD) protein
MVLGINHAELGAEILRNWSLPPELVNAVRWHHDPASAEHTDSMLDIVHVANMLCLMIGVGAGRDGLQYQPSGEAVKRLGLKSWHLEKVASQTIQWVEELFDVLGSN